MGLIKTDGIREVLGVTGEAAVGGSEMTGYQKVNFSVFTLYFPYLPTLIVRHAGSNVFTYPWDTLPGKQPTDVVLPYIWSDECPSC